MPNLLTMAVFAGGALLATASLAQAQNRDQRSMPRDGACFYEDANYRGDYFCVDADDELGTLPSGANDRISSIRVLGRAEVIAYESSRFRGESLNVERNVSNLDDEDFNDQISSVRIRGRSFGSGGNRPPTGPSPEVIVRRAYQDILEREPDQAGLRLYRSRIIDDGWTEQQVREALRRSPEYRDKSTMTRAKAEEIVRQAYLAVLKREPDAGSAGYVTNVLRDKWTQVDVERALRRSAEYRTNNR